MAEPIASKELPAYVHAWMADDQAEILRLRSELATITAECDEMRRIAFPHLDAPPGSRP